MNDKTPPRVRSVWLYHGLVDDDKGPLHRFEKITGSESEGFTRTGEFAHFSRDKGKVKTKLERAIPAWVYAIQTSADGVTFVFSTLEELTRWPDEHEAEAIMLAHRARERAERARRQQSKLEAELKNLTASLSPIGKAYRNTNPQGRIAIEILVLDALRKTRWS
jgi:hypothetical protein